MKRSDLLQRLDADFPDKPVGFCYARTRNSHEAEDLCSDILFRLVCAAQGDGDIAHGHAFIWRIAQNAYADFCARRRTESDRRCTDDTVQNCTGAVLFGFGAWPFCCGLPMNLLRAKVYHPTSANRPCRCNSSAAAS